MGGAHIQRRAKVLGHFKIFPYFLHKITNFQKHYFGDIYEPFL